MRGSSISPRPDLYSPRMQGQVAHVLSRPRSWGRRLFAGVDRGLERFIPEQQPRSLVSPLVCLTAACFLFMLAEPFPLVESLGEGLAKIALSWTYPLSLWQAWRMQRQARKEKVVRGRRNALLALLTLLPFYAWCMRALWLRDAFHLD